MELRISLGELGMVYTDLDSISGKVQLWLPEPGTITSVDVRLEGVSASKHVNTGKGSKPAEEVHNLVKQEVRVWGFHQGDANMLGHYTIAPGNYEWPFSFRFPSNTWCHAQSTSGLGRLQSVVKRGVRHVPAPLPPSMGGLPDFAGIVYFVKAAIRTKDLFSKDPDAWYPFKFLPLEPARPPASGSERYVRQDKRVGKLQYAESDGKPLPANARVDLRMPSAGIVTRGQMLPIKIFLNHIGGSTKEMFLQSLRVDLIGHTHAIVAGALEVRSNAWTISDQELLALNLNGSKQHGTETLENDPIELCGDQYWPNPIPSDMCPTFEVCNVKRWYEVDVRVGLSVEEKPSRSDITIVPLRIGCTVYSGITSTEALVSGARSEKIAQDPSSNKGLGEKPPAYAGDQGLPSYADATHGQLSLSNEPYRPKLTGPKGHDHTEKK